jgi:hypothetical protein
MGEYVIDYVALAREAARRWREANGIPLDADLSAFPSFNSSQRETEEDSPKDRETIAREGSTKETKKRKKRLERVAAGLLSYAFPWPDEIPALGSRAVGPFAPCACGRGSWVRYGGVVLCLSCANAVRP